MRLRAAGISIMIGLTGFAYGSDWENVGVMRSVLERYSADKGALERAYPVDETQARYERFGRFYKDWLGELQEMDFDSLPPGGRADWVVLKTKLEYEAADLVSDRKRFMEALPLIPFVDRVFGLHEVKMGKRRPDAKEQAEETAEILAAVGEARQRLQKRINAEGADAVASENVARRALGSLRSSGRRLDEWYGHYSGYDPMFTWWVKRPYDDLKKALADYVGFLDGAFFGGAADAATAIKGDPIGSEGMAMDLRMEMLSYSPEELLEIGQKELVWVDLEMKKAAKEMGYGDDWRAALEHVKGLHVAPGDQPDMVVDLAEEAVAYLEKHDLLTIPDTAKETWRLEMMSPARQLVSPFFLGGETVIVSFPTDTMTHEQKLMSMRSNNRMFSKSTVHHELIPGHHMQFYMASRFNTHRRGVIGTPFWIEGWALYWEFLFYQRGFAATPEERMGFLFWRKHRAARIVFSLSYHLGRMTADECVDMLANVVGHEQSTAEGEVRRSLEGSYPPLYQAAYMLGAFQMWDIRREVVDSGKMTEKEFHDSILKIGNMPWRVVKALLSGEEIKRDLKVDWGFYKGSLKGWGE